MSTQDELKELYQGENPKGNFIKETKNDSFFMGFWLGVLLTSVMWIAIVCLIF